MLRVPAPPGHGAARLPQHGPLAAPGCKRRTRKQPGGGGRQPRGPPPAVPPLPAGRPRLRPRAHGTTAPSGAGRAPPALENQRRAESPPETPQHPALAAAELHGTRTGSGQRPGPRQAAGGVLRDGTWRGPTPSSCQRFWRSFWSSAAGNLQAAPREGLSRARFKGFGFVHLGRKPSGLPGGCAPALRNRAEPPQNRW